MVNIHRRHLLQSVKFVLVANLKLFLIIGGCSDQWIYKDPLYIPRSHESINQVPFLYLPWRHFLPPGFILFIFGFKVSVEEPIEHNHFGLSGCSTEMGIIEPLSKIP